MISSTTSAIILAIAFSSTPLCLATNGNANTRSLESDPDAFCYSFGTDCRSCLREGCKFDGSQCIPDCSHAPADVSCYRLGTWPGVGLLGTCRKAKNAHLLKPWTATWEASSSSSSTSSSYSSFITQENFESSQGFSTGKATNDNTVHWPGTMTTTRQDKRTPNPTADIISTQEAFEISQGFSSGKAKRVHPEPLAGAKWQYKSMSSPHDGISKQEAAFELSQGFSANAENVNNEPWTAAMGQQQRISDFQDGISTQQDFELSQGFGDDRAKKDKTGQEEKVSNHEDNIKAQEAFELSQGFSSAKVQNSKAEDQAIAAGQDKSQDATNSQERFVINIEVPPQEEATTEHHQNESENTDEAANTEEGRAAPKESQGTVRGASPKKRKSILNFILP